MKKRTFLKLSSTLVTGAVFSPMVSFSQHTKLKNWAGNFEFSAGNVYYPESVEQVQELIKKYSKIKVLGTRHCFNKIADSTDNLLSTKNLDKLITIDAGAKTVTVGAGISYGKLCPYLDSKGFALHNLASLPHISVAGSCATATHGSGVKNGNLSTAISAIEMVNAAGDMINLSQKKDGDKFNGAVVGLGALGVVTKVTLNVQPTFMMRQNVYEHLPIEELKKHFDQIVAAGYSVSLFTDWQSDNINEVWIKSKVDNNVPFQAAPEFFGAKAASKNMHPIAALSAENCTEQMGVPGPWYDRMPHFRMGFTPSSGVELQSEYFVPLQNGLEAILAISKLSKLVGPQLFISEIRTINADNLWMSPCHDQQSMTIHFTWKQNWPEVQKLLPLIEKELAPFSARPHWGKLFTIAPAKLKSLYPKLADFQQLIKEYDPQGKFRNEFLDTNIYNS